MPSLIAPYTLPSENTTEAQLSQNFSQMYILMGKALYSRNECCNNQLKTIFFPDNSFFQVHSHFSSIFNKIINSSTFPGLEKLLSFFQVFQELWERCYIIEIVFCVIICCNMYMVQLCISSNHDQKYVTYLNTLILVDCF